MRISKFQLEVRTAVLQQLEMGSYNIAELTDKTRYNYHSVRLAVRALEQEGTIKAAKGSYRNVRYSLGTDFGPNNIIPMLRTMAAAGEYRTFKLQEVLELRKNENPHAVQAILNLPRHVVRILAASIRIAQGRTDAQLTLTALRSEMEYDLTALKNSIGVYEQILDDPRNWNLDTLKRYPNDATFDEEEVTKVYNYYFDSED